VVDVAAASPARTLDRQQAQTLGLGDGATGGSLIDASPLREPEVRWVAPSRCGVAVEREPPEHDFVSGDQVGAACDHLLPSEVRAVLGSLFSFVLGIALASARAPVHIT
jgi:hypothetical protein